MLTRRSLLASFAGGAVAAAPALAQRPNSRPNLLFVLIDDLRWDAIGAAGHPYVKTPHIDRLAREGALFKNAFVTTPLCSPARSSFLTGQYVRTTGIIDNTNRNERSHQLVTYPKLLKDAGYETAYIGKWHMGNDDTPRPGFDRWVGFRGQGVFNDPPLNIDGERITKQGYITDILSDYSVEFVSAKRSKPFCLYLAHKAIHGPFTPAERHANLYEDQPIQRAASWKDTLEGKPMLRRTVKEAIVKKKAETRPGQILGGPTDKTIKDQMRCMASIDEGLGRIIAALEKTGQLDSTCIIFTSDNGYFWGEHGLGDKRAAYDEALRIPMVARYPKLIKAGRKVDEMALNIDIAPTMLDLAGVKPPAAMQGRSLVPALTGKAKNWRPHFLCEYYLEQQFNRIATWEAVRSTRWKYIHYPDLRDSDELYDLQTDPQEMKNRIADPAAAKPLAELKAALDGYRKQVPKA